MITLSVIAYVIASLFIARYKYWDIKLESGRGNVNPCFMDGKKSLISGFLTIPTYTVIIGGALTLVYFIIKGFVIAIVWIITYMP